MRFFLGAICGVLLTVIAAFIADSLATADEPPGTHPQRIVNWDVAGERLNRSIETIRETLHQLTR
jgi:hypothetical protein